MKKHSILILFVLFFLASCTSQPNNYLRMSSSAYKDYLIVLDGKVNAKENQAYIQKEPQKNHHISIQSIEKSIDKISRNINQKPIFNANSCDKSLTEITNFLLFKGGESFLPLNKSDYERLHKRASIIVEKLFSLRLLLRGKLKEFHQQGTLSKSCIGKIRKAFRYSRFMEEFITETAINLSNKPIVANNHDFSQQKYQFYLNPQYKRFQIKSGDILLLRTSSFVSATIARLGDEDGQFSHAAMIYVDNEGEKKVIESTIQSGVIITSYEEWRANNHHARAILFRHHNEALAKKAAQKIFDAIQIRWESNNLILYDFKMNDSDPGSLYCSELIQYAFQLAGDNKIPTFRTSFKAFTGHSFLNELTINTEQAFSPGDLEIEPEINLVAEWRNYNDTRLARLQDVLQTQTLKWMSHKDYYLKGTIRSYLGSKIILLARKLFGVKRDEIPSNMPFGFLSNLIKLNDLNKILEKYLVGLEAEYNKKHGHSMDYQAMMTLMEKFRFEDCQSYVKRENEIQQKVYSIDSLSGPIESYESPKSAFHELFNTKNGFNCNLK